MKGGSKTPKAGLQHCFRPQVSVSRDRAGRALDRGPGPAPLPWSVKGEVERNYVVSVGFYSGAPGRWIFFQLNYEKSEKEIDGLLPDSETARKSNRVGLDKRKRILIQGKEDVLGEKWRKRKKTRGETAKQLPQAESTHLPYSF